MYRFFILSLIIAISVLSSYGEIVRNSWLFNSSEVLSSGYSGFTTDKDGFLWVGKENGLARFDGSGFDIYQYDENDSTSLSDNRIYKVLRDVNDRLWIATGDGLNLYDSETESFVRVKPENLNFNGFIIDICGRRNGDVVFMISGIGLFKIEFVEGKPKAVRLFGNNADLANTNSVCESEDGMLVIGRHDGAVFLVNSDGTTSKLMQGDAYIRTLVPAPDGKVFVSTTRKAWIVDPGSGAVTPLRFPAGTSPLLHTAVTCGAGDMLIGTLWNGIMRLPPKSDTVEPYSGVNNSGVNLDAARVTSIYEDPMGNLWLGCAHQGVVMVPETDIPYVQIRLNKELDSFQGMRTVVSYSPADPDNIWVGLEDGRLLSFGFDGLLRSTYRFGANISAMLSAANGRLYVGVEDNGLYEISYPGAKPRPMFDRNGSFRINSLAESADGSIYAAVHGCGIFCYSPDDDYSTPRKLSYDTNDFLWVNSMHCDSRGRLWIGLYSGLYVYDILSKEYVNIASRCPSMEKGVHLSIRESPDGVIWDATTNGLYKIDPEQYTAERYTTSDGLPENEISTLEIDRSGNLWIGSYSGISFVDRDMNVFPAIASDDAFFTSWFSSVSATDPSLLFFSNESGVTCVRPDLLHDKGAEHKIYITSISLNHKRISNASLSASGKRIIGNEGENYCIDISYADDNLVLRVSTKDFGDIQNTFYEWSIEGISDKWQIASGGVMELPHLDAGTYSLTVRAISNGHIVAKKRIEVNVSCPWYLSWPMKLLYALIFCSLVLFLMVFIRNRDRERLNEERIKFFINVSHEIRSPLTLILSPLEKIMKVPHSEEETRNLSLIRRNAERILALINQLLDIRKIEKGKMTLDFSNVEFVAFAREFVEMFKLQAQENNLTLDFRTDPEVLDNFEVCLDRSNFDKVLVNLITNAIKYTPGGGHIDVIVSRGENEKLGEYAQLSVFDTGIGLDEKNISNLFQRFYQGKFNRGVHPIGFGIGLDLCRQLVELHRGTISAVNRTDCKGSCFTVRLPLDNKEYFLVGTSEPTEMPAKPRVHVSSFIAETSIPVRRRVGNKSAMHIVVADDDAEMCSYVAEGIADFGRISTAANGKEAMTLIRQECPDLVITDVMMPEMDGLELLKAIKSNMSLNHIPVILLSSKADIADRIAGWERGADSYIPKPFHLDELRSVIEGLVLTRQRLHGRYSGAQEQDDNIATPELRSNETQFIDKIVKVINERLGDPNLNIEVLASEVGFSRTHLNRKMKEVFGITPREYIRNMRLRKACELLEKKDVDISMIAYSVGFSAQSYFSTAFKNYMGVSPSDYRLEKLKNQTAPSE